MRGNSAFPRSQAPPGKGASRFALAYRLTAYLTTGNKRADAEASELGSGGVGVAANALQAAGVTSNQFTADLLQSAHRQFPPSII